MANVLAFNNYNLLPKQMRYQTALLPDFIFLYSKFTILAKKKYLPNDSCIFSLMVTFTSFLLGMLGENWGKAFRLLPNFSKASTSNLNITPPNNKAIYITPGLSNGKAFY